jgi:chromate reductase, NAD(P)H dehydrogenase (quinone)
MSSEITQQALPTGTWSVDKIHSTVGFALKYMAGTFQGTFSDFGARLDDGVFSGSAEVASIQVKDPNLEAHLQSPDFFDAERFPQLRFVARDVGRAGDDLTMSGELTLKGHTEPVEIRGHMTDPAPDPFGGRALRPPARGDDRPDGVRPQLEQPAPERRPGARQRRHDHRRPAAGQGGVAMLVLGISGSLRRDSHNTRLLGAAGEVVEARGAEFEIYDGLKAIPPYDEDDDVGEGPGAVARLREAITGADALLFATPEYNSSIPGVLKNAIDWASRPAGAGALRNKPVIVIGASTGMFGGVWAQAELRKVLGATGARVAEAELAVGHAHEQLDPFGHPVDPAQREALRDSVEVLLSEVHDVAALAA